MNKLTAIASHLAVVIVSGGFGFYYFQPAASPDTRTLKASKSPYSTHSFVGHVPADRQLQTTACLTTAEGLQAENYWRVFFVTKQMDGYSGKLDERDWSTIGLTENPAEYRLKWVPVHREPWTSFPVCAWAALLRYNSMYVSIDGYWESIKSAAEQVIHFRRDHLERNMNLLDPEVRAYIVNMIKQRLERKSAMDKVNPYENPFTAIDKRWAGLQTLAESEENVDHLLKHATEIAFDDWVAGTPLPILIDKLSKLPLNVQENAMKKLIATSAELSPHELSQYARIQSRESPIREFTLLKLIDSLKEDPAAAAEWRKELK